MAILQRLQREGVKRGVLGSSRAWTVVAVVSFALRQVKKLAKDEPKVVYRERLEPGESLVISHTTETYG